MVRRCAVSRGNWVPTFLVLYVVYKRRPQTTQQRGATWRPGVLSPKATEVPPKRPGSIVPKFFFFFFF